MKTKFTRKTWYTVLVLSAALSMSGAFAALIHIDWNALGFIAFCAMGIATLFLAAERENDRKMQNRYFTSFMLALFGYIVAGVSGVVCAALAWPVLIYTEMRRGAKIAQQLQMLVICEIGNVIFTVMVVYGEFYNLGVYMNIFRVLTAIASGWAAYILLKEEKK